MPTANNIYSYCVDYSAMSSCLFSIQELYDQGDLNSYPELLRLINELEQGALKKLYTRTIILYGIIKNIAVDQSLIEGDFNQEYSAIDFNVGLFVDYTKGGFSSRFKTILNIFNEFCEDTTITEEQRNRLDEALSEVLDIFDRLQETLDVFGFNPCDNQLGAYRNNSPLIHIQAAGATGADGVAAGIHLRWGFNGHLGDNHLPQGTYANSSSNLTGYRKADDFVFVHRTPYANSVPILLDFETALPIVDSGSFRWSYIVNSSVADTNLRNRIRLVFKDSATYIALLATVDPLTDSFSFLKAYEGIIGIESLQKTFFSASFDFRKPAQLSSASLKLECIGKTKREINIEEVPVIRKSLILTNEDSAITTLLGENLSKISFKKDAGSYVKSFEFETYHDILVTRNTSDWEEVGAGFSLSLVDEEVEDRLEKLGIYDIDNLWPHYNEGTTVRSANYIDKWKNESRPYDPSLKSVVSTYLQLSETDSRARGLLNSLDGQNVPGLEISYLDVINMMAVDYHIGRMFGLGHIDTPVGTDEEKWLYRVSYQNKKNELSSQLVTHEYLSLPTSREDQRLPIRPSLQPLRYALGVQDDSNNEIIDDLGYSKVDRTRVVNIARQEHAYEALDEDFWNEKNEDWNIFERSHAVLYGIEYRPDSQVSYVKPEITVEDEDYVYYAYDNEASTGEIPESIPVPDNRDSLYTHFETEEGIHHYAIYGINIFSRASTISEEVGTDETIFPIINRLLPPTDISVQYIQEEETLLFTTQTEQDWLANRAALFPNMDISFTRVTFNWLDIVDVSDYPDITQISVEDVVKAKQIKGYFKPDGIFEVRGRIENVLPVEAFADQAIVVISTYTLINGVQHPSTIPASRFESFEGSWMSTQSGLFEIVSVNEQNGKTILLIRKQVITERSETEQPNEFNNDRRMVAPGYGEYFTFTENMSSASQWENITNVVELVDLGDSVQPLIETEVDDEGNSMHFLVGGLSANAIIVPLDEDNNQLQDLPGYYHVKFDSGISLSGHPQVNLPYDLSSPGSNNPAGMEAPHVEWYKGYIRVPYLSSPNRKKNVQVLRIVSLSPLELIIYDPAERQDPEAILISEDASDVIDVNFHPGYKAYFVSEPLPKKFNSVALTPEPNKNDRKVLLALQSNVADFDSKISVPVTFNIRKIIRPVQMEEIPVTRLRVRPDAKGKAAFTFDRKLLPENGMPRTPFGFMFFRISSQEVLDALYAPQTVAAILSDLEGLQEDIYSNQRYYELINLIYDPNNVGHFKVFNAIPTPYGFPAPDKPGLTATGDNQLTKLNKYRAAIRAELLPLTEQPPIFNFIKEGPNTENTEPVIRDIDNNLLSESDTRFNPFPMVRKFTVVQELGVWYIRFTDYTLRAASRFLYFYTAGEITNQLTIGPLSSYTGPVGILHTSADIPPNVVDYRQLYGLEIGVRFRMAPLLESKTVNKIRLYRAKLQDEVIMLSAFRDFVDVDFEELSDGSVEVVDDLENLELGGMIHFRLATVRKIINEFNEEEEVVSRPSEIISLNVIDSSNPEAPEISYVAWENKLTWEPTVANGNYHLFKQTKTGNWQQIKVFKNPDQPVMEYIIPGLPTFDDDGNRIYHRFKVNVQNASGLFNLIDREITI